MISGWKLEPVWRSCLDCGNVLALDGAQNKAISSRLGIVCWQQWCRAGFYLEAIPCQTCVIATRPNKSSLPAPFFFIPNVSLCLYLLNSCLPFLLFYIYFCCLSFVILICTFFSCQFPHIFFMFSSSMSLFHSSDISLTFLGFLLSF